MTTFNDPLKRFGDRVRELRRARNISQESLAHEAGIDRGNLGNIERGVVNITLRRLYKIAEALGVEPHELLK